MQTGCHVYFFVAQSPFQLLLWAILAVGVPLACLVMVIDWLGDLVEV